jgi:signal transduction histidine kinase/AmiR/NasT family two-component response regulator
VFKRLHTKLAAVYAALFIGAFAAIGLAVYVAARQSVEQIGRSQLASSGTVFDHLSAANNLALQNDAEVLASDFGFRAAVATGDNATIRSALDNLAARLGINLAFVVRSDGEVTGLARGGLPANVLKAVQVDDPTSGIINFGGVAYQAVLVPVRAPTPVGWVVFANRLGPGDMTKLERLSAIPLKAAIVGRRADGSWRAFGADSPLPISRNLAAFIDREVSAKTATPARIRDAGGDTLVLVWRLNGLDQSQPVALMLRYPLADALKPFQSLFVNIALIGAGGVLLLVFGSWLIAGGLTRPIAALSEATRRLQRGDKARVTVESDDELSRLGATFNAMADDIEEREANLKHALNLAEAADRAKGDFLANMNHEVRTPLNGVLGVSSVLATTDLDAGQRRMVELIQSSGEGLQRTLDAVLDFADIGAGRIQPLDEPFNLGALLRSIAAETGGLASAKGLGFDIRLDDSADHWVRGDAHRLTRVLSSLLSNAVKFTERGEVQVLAEWNAASAAYKIEVRDTGIGFESDKAEALFQAFSQGDGSMTRRFGGTGLGLSLARETARAMGGDITAKGRPAQGAAFVLTLPLAPAEGPSIAEPAADAAGERADDNAPLKVLLAEDHPANRTVVELILGTIGVDMVSVENGAEAVAAFAAQRFDVVLMDLQMPVMDGVTAIRLIRELEKNDDRGRTPIVVLSANVQAEHLRASAEAGADRHLGKPIVAPVLIAALEAALDQSGQEDALIAAVG